MRGPCAAIAVIDEKDQVFDGLGEDLAAWWATEWPEDLVLQVAT